MSNALSVINLGLGKIAANRCSTINPPKSSLERHCASGYPTWRDSELTKRTWYFSLRTTVLTLSPEATPTDMGDGRMSRYAVPTDMVRPIRDKRTRWIQRGKFIFDTSPVLTLEYVASIPESEWDAVFRDVVSCRVAQECVEFATQSNTKGDTADQKYAKAISEAAAANAFVAGPSDIRTDDSNDEWLMARYGYGAME